MTDAEAPAAADQVEAERALLRQVLVWMSQPPRRVVASAWNGHLGFANVLVALARPAGIVELGVNRGGSFFALCDACVRHGVAAEVIGVDTWQADTRTDKTERDDLYGELCELLAREWPFAHLVRADFDAARGGVPDGSVDLLHIDGCHTYEAVANDFSRWRSALSPRGICLFHDIAVRERGFGVHQLWGEVRDRWPSIEFQHSSGLGVLFTGAEQPEAMRAFLALWTGSPAAREAVSVCAELLSATFPARRREEEARRRAERLRRRVEELTGRCGEAETRLASVTGSRTWRWSAPLRRLLGRSGGTTT